MTKVQAVAIIESGDVLNKEIKSIGLAAGKLDDRIQAAGLSAIWHFGVRTNAAGELIGDVGFINRLYKSLGKGARHVAFTEWVTKFGGVSANTGADKKDNPFIKDANKSVDIQGAQELPWFDCKPSKAPDEVLDYYGLLMKALAKKAKEGQTVKHAALADKVRKLINDEMAQETQQEAEARALASAGEEPPM
jgi:HrpA-like RNA helicase